MKNKKAKNGETKLLFAICITVLALLLIIIGFVLFQVFSGDEEINPSQVSSVLLPSSQVISVNESSNENKTGLDPQFSKLLLVNGENVLPSNYDFEGNLTTIDKKYLCGYRNQMDKDVLPFATAMIEAAWKDNVELYILSPYRSYASQVTLFNNEVAKQKTNGLSKEDAEKKASTVVARPGTSEHHTGMAIDFNSVEDTFENTEAYQWLLENAEDYGFIMRYKAEKQSITGVINEPWHWRFVGINHAKKINQLDMCLEEYVEYLG